MCKYTPIEILEAFGAELELIEPHVNGFTQADTLMHANMCSFTKAVLEDFEIRDYEGMIFTTCCDSSRRLFDTLKKQYPDKFFFCVDLPRKINDFAVSLFEKQLLELIAAYADFSGKHFSEDALAEILHRKYEASRLIHPPKGDYDLQVALVGARPGADIKNLIENHNANILVDLTCTGINRSYKIDREHLLNSYAHSLLNQIPCMRMAAASNRERILEGYEDRIDGIIYHTVKFCDIYSYEYTHFTDGTARLKEMPILKIETDSTSQCAGQILTRLEAFLESMQAQKNHQSKGELQMETKGTFSNGYVMGIDSGSTSTNAVILNQDKEIVSYAVVRTGAKSGESAERILDEILEKTNLKREDLSLIVSTGYGRVSIPFADKNVTEISCHGKGAHFLNPNVRTILDIGGQDSKAIRLNENGDVIDFVMNDKCAAGTGRFLEMMARTLEIDLDELGPISLHAKENIEISSMCSVFAESEVISLIAQNKETADIAHGIHCAIASKAISLMKRVGLEKEYMMTGGVAKNPGVVSVLEEQLGASLYIYEEPEIVGAIGAALFGLESLL
jgi:predicted CoA-substrate-specific enzyme activase